MLEVQPYYDTVLADEVERAENIDEAAALASIARANEVIANKSTEMDYSVAMTELTEALAQIRVLQKLRKTVKM